MNASAQTRQAIEDAIDAEPFEGDVPGFVKALTARYTQLKSAKMTRGLVVAPRIRKNIEKKRLVTFLERRMAVDPSLDEAVRSMLSGHSLMDGSVAGGEESSDSEPEPVSEPSDDEEPLLPATQDEVQRALDAMDEVSLLMLNVAEPSSASDESLRAYLEEVKANEEPKLEIPADRALLERDVQRKQQPFLPTLQERAQRVAAKVDTNAHKAAVLWLLQKAADKVDNDVRTLLRVLRDTTKAAREAVQKERDEGARKKAEGCLAQLEAVAAEIGAQNDEIDTQVAQQETAGKVEQLKQFVGEHKVAVGAVGAAAVVFTGAALYWYYRVHASRWMCQAALHSGPNGYSVLVGQEGLDARGRQEAAAGVNLLYAAVGPAKSYMQAVVDEEQKKLMQIPMVHYLMFALIRGVKSLTDRISPKEWQIAMRALPVTVKDLQDLRSQREALGDGEDEVKWEDSASVFQIIGADKEKALTQLNKIRLGSPDIKNYPVMDPLTALRMFFVAFNQNTKLWPKLTALLRASGMDIRAQWAFVSSAIA